ncbi:MAG: DUF4239 domain-containing protein [Methylococcales bacterium]
MNFLYDLPNWLMGVTVVGACLIVTLASYFIFKKVVRQEFSESQISAAMGLVGVIATITSLLLAFSAVSVWEAFNSAETSVINEANAGAMLARDLAAYGGPATLKTRASVKEYGRIVVDEEWPLMSKREISTNAWNQIEAIFHDAALIEPKTEREKVLLQEIWTRLNELAKHRRERIHNSQAEVPETLWVVVLLGSALTFLFTFVLPVNRFNVGLISGLACALGLVFFFILAMDHPFAGKESISHAPFDSMIRNMDRWDANEARAKTTP